MPGPAAEARRGAGRVAQGATAVATRQAQCHGDAVVDFLAPPAMNIQQPAVQRPADQPGKGPVRERTEVRIVVAVPADPAAQQLLWRRRPVRHARAGAD